jgi:hypothetical protein
MVNGKRRYIQIIAHSFLYIAKVGLLGRDMCLTSSRLKSAITMNMKAASSFEILVPTYQTTRRHFPKARHLNFPSFLRIEDSELITLLFG